MFGEALFPRPPFSPMMRLSKRPMRNLVPELRQNASQPGSPTLLENSLARRLEAAYILRGQPVYVGWKNIVCYTVIPELSVFQVISQTSTRSWGSTEDVQELTDNIEPWFPCGILVLHHRLEKAFHFTPRKAPRMLGLERALGYAKDNPKCLNLAHITIYRGVAFAEVHVEHMDRNWKMKPCRIREFLSQHAMRLPLPCMMDRRQIMVRSVASAPLSSLLACEDGDSI